LRASTDFFLGRSLGFAAPSGISEATGSVIPTG